MMLIPGGKERTAEEYRALYEVRGFDLTRIVPTSTEISAVEGTPKYSDTNTELTYGR